MHVMPEVVLFSENKLQIQEIVKYCYLNNIHITSRGRGTGNTGGSVPIENSIVLSLEQMNKIIEIDIYNRLAIVQPVVINKTFQDSLKQLHFFLGPDPSYQDLSLITLGRFQTLHICSSLLSSYPRPTQCATRTSATRLCETRTTC